MTTPTRVLASLAVLLVTTLPTAHRVAAQEPAPAPYDPAPPPAPADWLPDGPAEAEPVPAPAEADEDEPHEKSPWGGSLQANGTSFFGNSDQRVFGGRGTLSRRDELVELEARAEIIYGDSEIEDSGRQVVKRALLGSLTADYRPNGTLSPFVYVTVETNLEKKIDTRYSIGVGAKQTFLKSKETESSLSVALLDELTVPRPTTAEPIPSTRLTRWSLRGRVRHRFDDRLRMTHMTFWQPSASTTSVYTMRSTSEAEYALTSVVGLATSMQVNYDSEAMLRGAQANHDGQFLFGVTARW